jgi:quercetin dioxygenase-like cupin family protein
MLVKSSAGCDVPMHFHSVTEQVMIVNGTMRFQMKGDAMRVLNAGAYATSPARHPHQATCSTDCEFYILSEGPFDIHYVDATGNEISLEQAIKISKKLEGGQ